MHARSYLRASTDEQDATRARAAVETFAAEHGLTIVGTYVENESGAKLTRPELFRLIADSRQDDVLLVEQVDRLSRLTDGDWRKLRAELNSKQIRVVALDLPTSSMLASAGDEFTKRTFAAVNDMMLDVLAAVARKDYEDRRRRQAEGQARAKAQGVYRGRKENAERNNGIAAMLRSGETWSAVQAAFGCSRATVAKIAKRPATGRAAVSQVLSGARKREAVGAKRRDVDR
jgi:DNA invertase Pin-like site-specific DNA recombinase